MPPKILFLGTPGFAVPVLEELVKQFQVIGVVTQPDRPVGRKLVLTPPPVKLKAKELTIPVFQPEKAMEIPELIKQEFDFLVTAAYGEYLPAEVLKLPKKDALNVHPSLLPKYRGATPLQSALLNGDNKTGVSVIRMAKEMDGGDIFAQQELIISSDTKYLELEEQCSLIGARLITEVIQNYENITPIEQDPTQATHCKKISKEDGQIHWGQETADQIYNKLRAFTPWPGSYTYYKQQKLSLLEFSPNQLIPNQLIPNQLISYPPPGTVFQQENKTYVQCRSGSVELKKVQLAGKKPVDIDSFINGHPEFVNS